MTAPPDLIVLCAGGHARVVIDILKRSGQRIAGLTDDDPARHRTQLDGVSILGSDEVVLDRGPDGVLLVNALGNGAAKIGDSGLAARRELFERFKAKGFSFAQVISPNAMVAGEVTLGEGCHVLTGAVIHPGSEVGANTIINTGAQLDHDNRIGPHCHIAPGAVLCGNVTVGAGSHIGAGAIILQGISIGANVVVGAGAVVVGSVRPGTTVLGNPARDVS